MKALVRLWTLRSAVLLALGLGAAGCGEDSKIEAEDGGAPVASQTKPVLDARLGAAMSAAAASAKSAPTAAAAADGPPETGIFPPGGADKAHPPGAPARVELLGEGSDPKTALSSALGEGEQKVRVTVSLRLGQQGLPSIDFDLGVKRAGSKDEKKKDEKKDDKAASEPTEARLVVLASAPNKEQMGQIPKDFVESIGKLKGTEIKLALFPGGVPGAFSVTPSKELEKIKDERTVTTLDLTLKSLIESLSLMTAPVPTKPVGVGAYWMVTDRSASLGIDVVRYRVYKVTKIEGDRVTLSLDVRSYAAQEAVQLAVASNTDGKLNLGQFISQGKGEVQRVPGALLSPGTELVQDMKTRFATGRSQQGKPMMGEIQTQLLAQAAAPEKGEKGEKK